MTDWRKLVNDLLRSGCRLKTILAETGLTYYKLDRLKHGEEVRANGDAYEKLKQMHDGFLKAGIIK